LLNDSAFAATLRGVAMEASAFRGTSLGRASLREKKGHSHRADMQPRPKSLEAK
jgi:hypothetical protein